MKLLIVEDEALLAKRLKTLLVKIEPAAEIMGHTSSIATTVHWLQQHPAPDLIFMDIELADGQCFQIFEQVSVKTPIIFTTAYDEFALRAFKLNSIDYLLKPIKEEELKAAIDKWKEIKGDKEHLPDLASLLKELRKEQATNIRDRFLVKQGQKLVPLPISDIALFFSKNTLTFLLTRSGQKFMIDYSLDEIEDSLPPKKFFRANRQFILAHDIISVIHPWFNGKLKLDINLPLEEEIIISRDKAPLFKEWMGA